MANKVGNPTGSSAAGTAAGPILSTVAIPVVTVRDSFAATSAAHTAVATEFAKEQRTVLFAESTVARRRRVETVHATQLVEKAVVLALKIVATPRPQSKLV
jgi:hypothetical protein